MPSQASPSLDIRPATPDDHAWLYDLHEKAHRELVERAYGPWAEAQQREFFAPLVNDHEVFILSDGDSPVGAVYLGSRDGHTVARTGGGLAGVPGTLDMAGVRRAGSWHGRRSSTPERSSRSTA